MSVFSSHILVLVVSYLLLYLCSLINSFSCQNIQQNFIKMAVSLIKKSFGHFSFVTYTEKWFGSFIFSHFIFTQMLAGLLSGCASRQLNSRCHVSKYPRSNILHHVQPINIIYITWHLYYIILLPQPPKQFYNLLAVHRRCFITLK